MKINVSIYIDADEEEAKILLLAWLDNNTNTTLEVFNPYAPEEKVGEITITEVNEIQDIE